MKRWLVVALWTTTLLAQTGARPMHAHGAMEVSTHPDPQATPGYSRFVLTKHYQGGLEAAAQGEMLSGGDPRAGSAGYVAMERVTGTLDGRAGSFQIMQLGTMDAGTPESRMVVVPGSGTGALQGITGTLQLENKGGQHSYTLDYTLPATQ